MAAAGNIAMNKQKPIKPDGSVLACRIADALMAGWQGFQASRLQLRGPDEQDMGGLCREAVVRVIDKELDAAALARRKPARMRTIRRILRKKMPSKLIREKPHERSIRKSSRRVPD